MFFIISFFLFFSECVPLLAFVLGFNKRCFLRSRCSMEMWCPDNTGRDSSGLVGPPSRERAWFNSPDWGGSSSRRTRTVAKENGASLDWIIVVLVLVLVLVSDACYREAMSLSTRATVTGTCLHVARHLGVRLRAFPPSQPRMIENCVSSGAPRKTLKN